VSVHHVVEGTGPPLVLSSSLGTTHALWEPNVAALAARYTLVRYDHPGHGRSPAGPRSIEGFGRGALELADGLELERFAFCGISLGGMVGIWLAANAPERIERLVLACTAPCLPPAEQWVERAAAVRERGIEAIADAVVDRWFTERFPDPRPWREHLLETPPEGYARACEAIAAMDLRADLDRIVAATTVILGAHDPVVGEENERLLARLGPIVKLDAAHLANVERPRAFADTVLQA
jgi:3-oxoadipate enol-lactonase